MGREGGEVALDGLGIADVSKDGVEEGQGGLGGGDGHAGLGHDREKAEGLEANGFATGVGAGDDELARAALEDKGEWDDADAFLGEAEGEQRVAGTAQGDGAVVAVPAVAAGEGGAQAVELLGELGTGGEGVELGEDLGGGNEGVGVLADGAGHADEDAVDFGLLLVEEAEEFVVGLDGLHWLDEDSLAGGGRAVDDAGDAAAEFGLDGDDEAIAAEGDDLVLDSAGFRDRT